MLKKLFAYNLSVETTDEEESTKRLKMLEPEPVACQCNKNKNVLVQANAFHRVDEYNSLIGGLNSSLHLEEISPSLTKPAETSRVPLNEHDESSVKI